jgi:hypothetical protein
MAKTALLFMPVLQFFSDTGAVLNGGSLTFYEAGTTTSKDTYADSAKAVTNPNPITLDSAGRPDNSGSPIQVWLDGSYKVVVKDSSGSTVRTEDNVTALAEATGYAAKTADYIAVAADFGKLINVDASGANRTVTLPAASAAGAGFKIAIAKSDSSSNTVTIDGNAAETVKGSATLVLRNQYDIAALICDGTNWVVESQLIGSIIDGASDLDITKAVEITTGNFTVTSGNIIVTSGDATLTSGNLTLTSGNAVLTSGNLTLTDGDLTMSKGTVTIADEDARTNTVDNLLTLTSTTSGTPAAGIGTGILVQAESADEATSDFGRLDFRAVDVSAGSEDTDFVIQTRVAGAALSNAYKFRVTGTGNYITTGAPTAERTLTLPDTDASLGSGWELVSSTSISSDATVEFTNLSSTYSRYQVVLDSIVPATDNTTLMMRVSTDNGSTWENTNYSWVRISAGTSSALAKSSGTTDTAFDINAALGNTGNESWSGEITVFNPGQSGEYTRLRSNQSMSSAAAEFIISMSTGAWVGATTAIDGIQFLMSSGNLTSGTITLYRIR